MYEGCNVDLQMEKIIKKGEALDDSIYLCEMLTYIPEEERLYLRLQEEPLTSLSLDAMYECRISNEQDGEVVACTGMVIDRYQGREGNTVIFQIENGFYKILI